jgi:iron complex outermembrane receptor protein
MLTWSFPEFASTVILKTKLLKSIFPAGFLTFILSILYLPGWSQVNKSECDYWFEGWVFELNTNIPLEFVSIQIEGTSIGTYTDENGHFEFNNLCQKEFDLLFSHLGYKPLEHHHDPHHPNPSIFLAPREMLLEGVVIEEHFTGAEIRSTTGTKLSHDELQRFSSDNLGELAGRIQGVSMISTGQNITKPVIHGLHSNRVLLINNGIRHEFQNWGSEHAPEIDPSLAESIEVIKGAATVRYGPEALGGVLLINPEKPDLKSPLAGSLALTGKTNGRSLDGTMKLSRGFRRLALIGEVSAIRQGDLSTPDYWLTNTGKSESSLALGALYHLPSIDFEMYYSNFSQELGILRGSVTGNLQDLVIAMENEPPPDTRNFSYEIRNPRQEVYHNLLKLKGSWLGTNQELVFNYGFQQNHRMEFDIRRGTNNERPAIDLELATHSLDLDWVHPESGNVNGRIGLQLMAQDNNNRPGTNTLPFIPNYNNYRAGIYLIESFRLPQSTLEAGLRFDWQQTSIRGRDSGNDVFRDELNFRNFTFTFGLIQLLGEGLSFRSNLGTAWRPPNVSELYAFGKHRATVEFGLWRYTVGENNTINTDRVLSSDEKTIASEIGNKWVNTLTLEKNKVKAELTGYLQYIQNYIYTRPAGITNTVRGAFPYFVYDQADALLWGIDFGMTINHSEKLFSELRGSYLWARQLEDQSSFANLPPADLNYQLNFLHEMKSSGQFNITAGIGYTFKQFQAPRVITASEILNTSSGNPFSLNNQIFDFQPAPPGYLLIDLIASFKKKRFSYSFQLRNILNNGYRNYTDQLRYFADAVGINYVFRIEYSL